MSNHDDDLNQLAVKIERVIAETRTFLNELPEYAPRSQRSKNLQQQFGKEP